jgi:small GTP-binding protein
MGMKQFWTVFIIISLKLYKMSQTDHIKIVVIGEANAGKSSIIRRFTDGTFNDSDTPTVGAAFFTKTLNHYRIKAKLNIWDTAGQDRFHSLTKLYSKDANIIILVYDITSRKSFENIKFWYNTLNQNTNEENLIYAVVGNKVDLIEFQEVLPEESKKFADSIQAFFTNTSAKNNIGISELFKTTSENYLKKKPYRLSDTFKLSSQIIPRKKGKCCA